MQPRAFIVMPFGRRPSARDGIDVDFNRIFKELFEPALRQAGFDVSRADSERSAGDIRTDMFFELVTADLVVADVSMLNGNVFYELGVRHGVCPHGVIVVGNDSMPKPPFDIAPDRIFTYETGPFECSADGAATNASPAPHDLTGPIEILAKTFKDACALDAQATGSPVYSHLPGLKPVNWEDIETSKAKYFTALGADWLDRVRRAQARGRPGDIITLAQNAPTRLHESRILFEAAKALVDLSRYSAAARVLRDIIHMDPENADAQIQLAMVLSKMDEFPTAEHELRKLSQKYKDRPRAANLLGQVFRHLWHLSWQADGKDDRMARRKAKDASQLAVSAVHSFLRAHRADPRGYYAAFNALMLVYLLDEIGVKHLQLPSNLDELKAITRYVARHERQQAIEGGNYEQQFWSTTALAGILFIEGKHKAALREIRAACAIPAATSFQLQSFRDRLVLLVELKVQFEFVKQALRIVDTALGKRSSHCPCERVFLWAGYPIDRAGQTKRFPAQHVHAAATAIRKILADECGMKDGDLAICGGTNESDIIFAEICLELGARVRVLVREPIGRELSEPLWPFATPEWNARFHALMPVVPPVHGERREVWLDAEALGESVDGSLTVDPVTFASHRLTQWLINTAEMEAEPAAKIVKPPEAARAAGGLLHGVFLWTGDPTEDQALLIKRVNEFDHYRGRVHAIHPADLG